VERATRTGRSDGLAAAARAWRVNPLPRLAALRAEKQMFRLSDVRGDGCGQRGRWNDFAEENTADREFSDAQCACQSLLRRDKDHRGLRFATLMSVGAVFRYCFGKSQLLPSHRNVHLLTRCLPPFRAMAPALRFGHRGGPIRCAAPRRSVLIKPTARASDK
jgi:hypothetical protein